MLQQNVLQLALQHQQPQLAARQILFGQECAAGDIATVDIPIGDLLHQRLDLAQIQTLLQIRLREFTLCTGGQMIRAFQPDMGDAKTRSASVGVG
ncbi:hypothetical protein D3C71_1569660 [compost metagenome]